jgi:hypothetical protein
LTNAAMPGMVKIGMTSIDSVGTRLKQLYTTGVPVPFELAFACRVENHDEVEKALHIAFGPNRVNPMREFFSIDPEQAIAILRLLHLPETTTELASEETGIDAQSQNAALVLKARRPNLDFHEMGIPVGSVLHCTNGIDSVEVTGNRKVKFQGTDNEIYLTAATRIAMKFEHDVAPGAFWSYLGKSIRDIYEETYPVGNPS